MNQTQLKQKYTSMYTNAFCSTGGTHWWGMYEQAFFSGGKGGGGGGERRVINNLSNNIL